MSLPYTAKRFGNKIRKLREERNWSLAQLEKISGINRKYLSKIENGTAIRVKLNYASILAKSFNISLEEILTFTE